MQGEPMNELSMIEEQIRSGKVSLGLAINGGTPRNPDKDCSPNKTTRIIERYFFKTKTKQRGYRLTPDEKVAIYRFNLEDPFEFSPNNNFRGYNKFVGDV